MTNSQAFWKGFWSVWDFTRPFSEKAEFRTCSHDTTQMREELGLNESVWESVGGYFGTVGGYLNKAMETIDEEIKQNDGNRHSA